MFSCIRGIEMSWITPEFERLLTAAAGGNLDTVRSLLDGGVNLNADYGAPRGRSPLMVAAGNGHLTVVRLLVEQGARLDAVEVDSWWTALDIARHAGWVEVEAYLTAAGAPSGKCVPNPDRSGKPGGWGVVDAGPDAAGVDPNG
jgi:ankyrin repeat protein